MKFAGPDDVRAAVKTNPLFAEWALTLLVTRGVLAFTNEGGLIGAEVKKQRGGKRDAGSWGQSWPRRENLIAALENMGQKGAVLGDIRRALMDLGDIDSQWSVLHGLWFLEKEKVVRRAGRRYILVGIEGLEKNRKARARRKWYQDLWARATEAEKAAWLEATKNGGLAVEVLTNKLRDSGAWSFWEKVSLTEDAINHLCEVAWDIPYRDAPAESADPDPEADVTSGDEGGAQ